MFIVYEVAWKQVYHFDQALILDVIKLANLS